mgnify:CR=1 FL=1
MTVPQIKPVLKATGIRGKQLSCLLTIIDKLIELQTDLDDALASVTLAEKLPRCCGSEYVDPNGFTYANHGISDVCPLHGQHPKSPGKRRLRLYIGNKPEAVEALRHAINNYIHWHDASRIAQEKQKRLSNLVDELEAAKRVAVNGQRSID